MSEDGCDPVGSLAGIRAEIVERLRLRHSEIGQAIYARIQEAVPDSPVGGRDPTYQAGLLAAVTAVLSYSLDAIDHGQGWSGPIPAEAAAQARRAARAGVSSGTVLRRYVAGHCRLGEFVAEEAERIGFSSNGSALHHLRRTQEALLEHLTAAIEHEYNQERQWASRSPEQRRAELVQKLLAGAPVDPTELRTLGYEFDAWHLCVIATGGNAEKAVRCLAAALGRELLPSHCGGEIWAWLGGQRKLMITDVERVLSAQGDAGLSVAVGEAAGGLEGWRLTHREAKAALLVARYRPRKLTRYLDVALEAAALQDEALAHSLIEAYLSPLDDRRDGGAVRRRMLRAFFDAEHNESSAAAELKVDRSTVHRWRGEIERRLGCRLHERQAEIEVALRLEDLRAHHSAERSPSERLDWQHPDASSLRLDATE